MISLLLRGVPVGHDGDARSARVARGQEAGRGRAPQYWMPDAFRFSAVHTMISSRSGRSFLTAPAAHDRAAFAAPGPWFRTARPRPRGSGRRPASDTSRSRSGPLRDPARKHAPGRSARCDGTSCRSASSVSPRPWSRWGRRSSQRRPRRPRHGRPLAPDGAQARLRRVDRGPRYSRSRG